MSTVKGLGEKPTTTTGHPMLNTKKFEVIHEYFGHDDRDGLTHEGHYVARTDDAVAAFCCCSTVRTKARSRPIFRGRRRGRSLRG